MNRRILIQIATPPVIVGLVLLGACLISAWYVNRLQANMTDILTSNVSSLRAAQQLEISLRQVRFHCFLYLLDPDPSLKDEIEFDHLDFEEWLKRAAAVAFTPQERRYVEAVREGYDRYRAEFEKMSKDVERHGPRKDYRQLANAHPLRHVIQPCREYLRLNEEMMMETAAESNRVRQRLHVALLLLGLVGPLGGLLSGYGVARGLSRSIHRLSVRVQDMFQHLDQDVGAVQITSGGDLQELDAQLQHVVSRVTEVGERLQRQHREIIRAQQLSAVGQLAASVAHEVRNPLTAIKMLVEAALRQSKPRPFTNDNLRVIHGEVLRLEQTVQSFLDFARPPALHRQNGDLCLVLARAVELVRARARQQRVQIVNRVSESPLVGEFDHNQLCTVMVNLFINALDAMPAGGRLEVDLAARATNQACMTVADTGTGIPPNMIDQLFTPFVSTKITGSGLGLSISRRIIEEHGGAIHAANRPEGGACFTFDLPIALGEEIHANTACR